MALTTSRGVHPGDCLVVIHDFDARGNDELNLRRGEKIELVELDDGFGDGWYLGKDVKSGTTGLFPGVYTTLSPRIQTQPQTDPSSNSHTSEEAGIEVPVASKSGQSTPQASRHVSASEIQSPVDSSKPPSPKPHPPQRSSSTPLPHRNMALDVQQSFKKTIDNHMNGQDSPVMNETLSVIDEHITDLSTPRHSHAHQESKATNDSESEYSSHIGHRMSYINGHETDEEEENQPSEEQVRSWNQHETAKRLRDLGIDAKHCDIFEEQEITGDVLLDMDQDFVFMKEFDFGVMGRRLKTWHKIKAFQEEVKAFHPQSSHPESSEERSASRAGHTGSFLPRIPTFSDKSGHNTSRASSISTQHQPRLASMQSNISHASTFPIEAPPKRPSAAEVREFNHSRRHSSIDTTKSFELAESPPRVSHQTKPSLDRTWSMAGGSQRLPPRPGTSMGTTTEGMFPQPMTRTADANECDSAISVTDRYDDLDRGYFSGPEGDSKKNKRVLVKRSSAKSGSLSHSRKSSYNDEPSRISVGKRHSRIGSVDSIRDAAKHASFSKQAASAPPKSRIRSLSTRITDRSGHSSHSSNAPPVEDKAANGPGFFSSLVGGKTNSESPARSSPIPFKNAGPKFRRAVGLRTTPDGKGVDTTVDTSSPVRDADPSSARTGSTTPSATSKSSERQSTERQSTDGSGKVTESGIPLPRPKPSVRAGTKSKKDTSAYIQGLEKKEPQEQMVECDYSGWMKKRSSNMMTTWKPRLFVLRGRRLSYYYSEQDKEERGLIDITGHRVLRADNDPIITLHATLTGATASSTSPVNSTNNTQSYGEKTSSESSRARKSDNSGPFFFKLVPPKAGVARSVQFTKPAIHYFQVDTIKEGRLWMAALMKATIERDMEHRVETTNKQKTISLKQARMMNQRPPALVNTPTPQEQDEDEADEQNKETGETPTTNDGNGLGLGLDQSPGSRDGGSKEQPAKPLCSNPLGGLDTGPSTLLPEGLEKK